MGSAAQIAVIDGEVLFLQGVTAVSGGWQLNGLIRARATAHRVPRILSVRMFLSLPPTRCRPFRGPAIRAGSTVYVKSQPSTSSDQVDISTVTAVTLAVVAPSTAIDDSLLNNSYTIASGVAHLPAASSFGWGVAVVTDPASGKGALVISNGTNWLYVSDLSTAL